ncbi:glycosyltransferase [Roseococcus sp. SDR]|uniref:glycosyltransferase n=1 Tax=Roseococcus sp. SDR TaxID=2835532 RepID=UPI001BD0B423|nr:glycosyltransferase [Roseococcus sp. SDR]MBS7793113.1 glycosyltransferase [Roseococcus sp. SDR]MBV1848427.1 glycosyltransferase [Roseococcus sp. SDR]
MPVQRVVFTLCSANYLPVATPLMHSLAAQEPHARRVLVLAERELPEPARRDLAGFLHCEILLCTEIGVPHLDRMAFQYDHTEFNTALKPFVFQFLFRQGHERVVYLDPDIELHQSLDLVWDALDEHDATVTPHILEPLPEDGCAPTNENMARCGQFNFGFVAFANRAASRAFLDWWAERLTDHCIFHPNHFFFVDQFYGAMVASFVERCCILHHPGLNFAYWNAPQRPLAWGDTGFEVAGAPLVFAHFSGFAPQDPLALSRHQNRLRAEAGTPLGMLLEAYAGRVRDAAAALPSGILAGTYDNYTDGVAVDALERRKYRDLQVVEKAQLPPPFSPELRARLGLYGYVDDAATSPLGLMDQLLRVEGDLRAAQQASANAAAQAAHDVAFAQHTCRSEVAAAQQARDEAEGRLSRFLRDMEEQTQELEQLVMLRTEELRRLRPLVEQVQVLQARASHAESAYAAILGSEAWQLTRPLRSLGERLPRVSRLARQALKVAWWTVTLQLPHRIKLWRAHRRRMTEASSLAVAPEPSALIQAPLPQPATILQASEPELRTEPVDIIVCVHDALDDVRRCLTVLLQTTMPPFRLILIDDGSQQPTAEFLRGFAADHGATLVRNEIAKGYTLAANQGLRLVEAPYCVLLNSDTEVTIGWLDRMVDAMRSNPRLGLVGPLSNTASWQSVPALFADGDWAPNDLMDGLSVADMGRIVGRVGSAQPIPIGFLNGFCMLVRAEVLTEVGLFDEATFGAGYGEENDFCIRARNKGWHLAVAEQAYVAHHQSRSYGNERRRQLAARADAALAAKHDVGTQIIPFVERCRSSLRINSVRARLQADLHRVELIRAAAGRFEGKRVAFVLPVGAAGGGANVVIQEALALRTFGAEPIIVNLADFRASFEADYPTLKIPVRYWHRDEDLLDAIGMRVDALVATAWSSFEDVKQARALPGVRAYYIQDLETLFYQPSDPRYGHALATYLDHEVVRFTKSTWNGAAVAELSGSAPIVIGPSVDVGKFRPLSDEGLDPGRPVRVMAMVRPSTPRRAPELTARILSELVSRFGSEVEVYCFGGSIEEIQHASLGLRGVRSLGHLPASAMPDVLGNTDVFLDFSVWQAMGLTALEAMASGAAVVVPRRGGTSDFCVHEVNSLMVDTTDEAACLEAASRLIEDSGLRTRLRLEGMQTASAFAPEVSAFNLLEGLFPR